MNIKYYWNKLLKKCRGSAVLNSTIHRTSKVESGSQFVNSTMDKYSFCGYDCNIVNSSIGSYCSIADNVIIGPSSHPLNWVSTSPAFYYGRDSIPKNLAKLDFNPGEKITVVESDVWIGTNVLIKSGVTIGVGAVIGMGSVVTKDVLPYSIVAGVPAKQIGTRFDKGIVDRLLKSKWWEKSDIDKYSNLFNDPEKFLEKLE